MNARPNPYIGPRSFRTGEKIFGRGREIAELTDLLIAERIVLMSSPSGAGKSSLINAGVIPLMKERGFTVLPPIRVSRSLPSGVVLPSGTNRFVVSLLLSLEETQKDEQPLPLEMLMKITLEDYLAQRVPFDASSTSVLFVFDQFEEILTIDATQRAAKHEFFSQVGRVLRDRTRWALFAVREEYVAALMPYGRSIPTRFATSFRLDLLTKAAAMDAIHEPARQAGIPFEQAAVEELEQFLSRVRVQHPDGTVIEEPGEYIEPVQLQVACRRLWETLSSTATAITADHVKGVGQVARALADYYDSVVATAAPLATGGERTVREWVEKALITPNGIRSEVMQTPKVSGGLDNSAISKLVDGYLVREESRRGNIWYELAHDRLIEPARTSNAEWFEKSLQPVQRQADLWEREGRPDRLLLRGQDLTKAESWAGANRAAVRLVEADFLERSTNRSRAARTKVIASSLILSVVLVILSLWLDQRFQAARMAELYQATLLKESESWTAYANSALENGNPGQAELLALRALPMDAQHVRPRLQEALTVLLKALGNDRQRAILVDHTWSNGAVKDVAVSQDGKRIATASDDRTARIFEARTGAALLALKEHTGKVNSVAFSPSGQNVVTASDDGTARVWNVVTGECIATLRADGGSIRSARFGADDNHIATAAEDGARIWDLSDKPPRPKLLPGGGVTVVSFSPDGQRVAAAGKDHLVRLFTANGFPGHILSGPNQEINAVSFSRNGERLVAASDDGHAWVWKIDNPVAEAQLPVHGKVLNADFSRNGSQIVTASNQGAQLFNATNKGFDPTSKIQKFEGLQGGISVARFSPDAQERWIVTASDDATARLWDPKDGSSAAAILQEHRSKINAAVFTTDAERLVTGSDDGTVRVWDTRPSAAIPLLTTKPLTEWADQIAFSLIAATRDPQSPDQFQFPSKAAVPTIMQKAPDPCARLDTQPLDPREASPDSTHPALEDIVACRTQADSTNNPQFLYQLGRGLENSGKRAEAATRYEAAANLGSGAARFRLALISFDQKEPFNKTRAIQHLKQGAELGDPYCHRRLAELYESGTEGPADLQRALFHYLIALRLFGSKVDVRNARYRAASIARNSSPNEVVKSGRDAATWLSSYSRVTTLMTLMLHSGANPVSYDELRAVQLPTATDTHVPVALPR